MVAEWRTSGRHTTTAGITSALKATGVLDLPSLGLASNREFWELAGRSGMLRLEQQVNGHWMILLPGESMADIVPQPSRDAPTTAPDSGPRAAAPEVDVRLKGDVWTCFVDWNPAYRRFWDRDHARAFMVPTAPGWPTETTDPSRFVQIEPAGQGVQIDWMRDFANQFDSPNREGLLAALHHDAPRGAFRRELRSRGLARRWRTALGDHIVSVAVAWARERSIEVSSIMENRNRDFGAVGDGDHGKVSHGPGPSGRANATNAPAPVDVDTDRLLVLRERLHHVIDHMTWDELSRIEVRAEHLVRF